MSPLQLLFLLASPHHRPGALAASADNISWVTRHLYPRVMNTSVHRRLAQLQVQLQETSMRDYSGDPNYLGQKVNCEPHRFNAAGMPLRGLSQPVSTHAGWPLAR